MEQTYTNFIVSIITLHANTFYFRAMCNEKRNKSIFSVFVAGSALTDRSLGIFGIFVFSKIRIALSYKMDIHHVSYGSTISFAPGTGGGGGKGYVPRRTTQKYCKNSSVRWWIESGKIDGLTDVKLFGRQLGQSKDLNLIENDKRIKSNLTLQSLVRVLSF